MTLYDRTGSKVLQLPRTVSDRVFCVCVTNDSFGPIATFLSLLLSKKAEDPYPWVVSILDLQQIADMWEGFRWDGRQLKSYLSQRVLLHGRVFSDDELDYVGAYVRHCGLHHFAQSNGDVVQLDPTYATIFNDIYYHRHHGEPLVRINPVYPVAMNLKDSVNADKPIFAEDVSEGPIVVGRNESCPCGSGVKFKRCHGR